MKDKIILIYGDEPFLINKKIDEIINIDSVIVYDMEVSSMEDVKEEAISFSMFSDSKDILCNNCNFLTSSLDNKEYSEILIDILNKPIDNRLILIVNGKVDERKKAVKELIKIGKVFVFNALKDYEMTKYIGEQFKKKGYQIDISTINYFQNYVGNNLYIINNEIEKMDLYKEDNVVTKEDINAVSSKAIEDNIFELIDAVVNKNIDKALKIYDDLILMNEDEVKLISILADQFRLIFQTKNLYNLGFSEANVIKQLDIHPYRIKLASSSHISMEEAKRFLIKLYNLDVSIKTGKKEKKSAFKMFLLEL